MARSTLRIPLATMAALWLAVGTAAADNIFIDDLAEGQPIVTTDGDPGRIQIATDSGPEFLHFFYTSTLAAASTGSAYVDMLDPTGDPNAGSLSDRLLISLVAGSPVLEVTFASDPASVSATGTNLGSVDETGSYQLLITYINLGTGAVIDSFNARSDVEVPEPSSFALCGVGLATLVGFAARRRRGAKARA